MIIMIMNGDNYISLQKKEGGKKGGKRSNPLHICPTEKSKLLSI